ncbi:UNVERIFIED_CONTAM: hypothetical protein K2H54_010959 [Gekko kuhli]
MDLGTLQNNVNNTLDNVYEEGPDSDRLRALSNGNPVSNDEQANLLTGADTVKRSQPLLIQSNRKPKEEEVPRALSLPSIPNPFPELCSPSNSPILSNSSLGSGSQREGVSHCRSGETTEGKANAESALRELRKGLAVGGMGAEEAQFVLPGGSQARLVLGPRFLPRAENRPEVSQLLGQGLKNLRSTIEGSKLAGHGRVRPVAVGTVAEAPRFCLGLH